jgi:putative heme-binding domain-containing protein
MRPKLTALLLFLLGTLQVHAWEPIDLPTPPSESPHWYRCRIQVPVRLVVPEANNERDLWRSSTMLVIRGQIAHIEIFLNGEKIVTAKDIPDGQSQRFKVPKDILVSKKFNTLAIHVKEGSLPKAPLLIDYFNELELGPEWEQIHTKPEPADLQAVEKQPTHAFYTAANFRLSATPLDSTIEPIPGKRVPPGESLAALQTDDDLVVEQLLHEPQVAQPTHVSFDSRGRMWVSQYRQYPYPAGVKMLSRDQYYRSKYDKTPPAPPYHDRGADIISVHEDSDGDGRYDKHTNVLEGLNMANSAVRGWGGFWVMHTPYLLFYPDADGDDIPDRAPEVRLAGFGLEDTHSVANGLAWGPDGWLYGGQGSTTTSRVIRPDIDPKDAPGVYNEGCMVWRYHPATKQYEIFADGGGNTFGLSFDAEGRLFSGHNGGSTRGWHHIQEGQFLKQGKNPGKFGPPPNPYTFGELQMMRSTNPVPRFSHMSVVVGGSAMPKRFQEKFLGADPLHHYLVHADRKTRGSTFETTDLGFPLRTDKDITFRPVYLANAPDGSMVVADFCEQYIAHGQNYQGQIDPTSGRIYRLRGKAEKLESDYNLEAKTSAQLVQVLSHDNLWHRHTAARILGQRGDKSVLPALLDALGKPDLHPALDALWALHQMGQLDEDIAVQTLQHPAPQVRAWVIRLMGDSRELPDGFSAALLSAAKSEPSAEVRSQTLSTAARLSSAENALHLIDETVFPQSDLDDPNIPAMMWFAIERHCTADADLIITNLEHDPLWERPLFKSYIIPRLIRRFAESGTRRDLLHCARLLELAPTKETKTALLSGFEQAFDGRVPPPFPAELLAQLGDGSLSMQIRQGKAQSLAEGLAILSQPAAEQLAVIHAFGTYAHQPAVSPLIRLATTSGTNQAAALAALQIYTDPEIASALTKKFPTLPAQLKPAALNLLGSRQAWTLELLESEAVPKTGFDPDLIARLRLHPSEPLKTLLDKHFPNSNQAADPRAKTETIRKILAAKPGNPYRGETHYTARCAACHTLFFKGGKVGPDLTRYQRDDLSTMLNSIVDPNAEIREGYENFLVTTKDGRLLSGFLAEEDANTIVMRGFDDSNTTIPRKQIKQLKPAGRSLMPAGLLDGLDDQQLRDLFAYLRISQPISK